MADPSQIGRVSIALLVVLDVLCGVAIVRLPSRIELSEPLGAVPNAAPGLSVVTDTEARFVVSPPAGVGETVLVRVPLDPAGNGASRGPTTLRLGRDLALLEPVRSLDAFMPSGPRFAWNGRTLVLAAPSRRLGAHEITVAVIGPNGFEGLPQTIDGSRPSVGWAGDRFEVGYVTVAPMDQPGRVEWIVDVDEHGSLSNPRIVEAAGQVHDPFVWIGGVRQHAHGAEPNEVLLQDGRVVSLARVEGDRTRPFFVLARDGSIETRTVRSRALSGSERGGDYTIRAAWGPDTTLEAHLGARVSRPRWELSHRGVRRVFEVSADARVADMIAIERRGVLHLIDPRGIHARFRAADLFPLDRRTGRFAWLAGALGATIFTLLIVAMVLAHAMALIAERAARGAEGLRRVATLAGLSSISFAGIVLYVLWTQ